MEEATLQHLHDLKQPLTGVVLQDPRKPDAKLAAAIVEVFGRDAGEVYTAKLARIHSRAVCNGDVVAFDHDGRRRFGQVFFHVSVNGRLHSCVSPWDTIEEHGRMAKCIVRDAPIVLASSQIFESCVYSSAKVGTVSQIIVPYALR